MGGVATAGPNSDETWSAALSQANRRQRNPSRRLTQPEDWLAIAPLCHPATYWLTGNTLHVYGGENIVG